MKKNPFKPSFGGIPISMAGREDIIDDIIGGLENEPGDPNRASIFVGARGTGKTVMMAKIAEIASQKGWVNVDVTSGENLLEEVIVQIRENAGHLLYPQSVKRIKAFSVAGASITFSYSKEHSTWRSEVTKLIKEINDAGSGLLITVDEISVRDDGLKTLVETFQHFVRERRNVAILMAGLPTNISSMLMDERVTFVRRAFKHKLDTISTVDVAYAIRETVHSGGRKINEDALWTAAEFSEGFAFMIQLIGYHMWRQSAENETITIDDVNAAKEYARRDMESAIFEDMIGELTEREIEFVTAMIPDDVCTTIEISDRMGVSPNNVTHIKKRLIERGVIVPAGRGKVRFAQSALAGYINKNILKYN